MCKIIESLADNSIVNFISFLDLEVSKAVLPSSCVLFSVHIGVITLIFRDAKGMN